MATENQNKADELQALKIENEKLAKEVWKSIQSLRTETQKSIADTQKSLSDKIADTNKSVAETQKSVAETQKSIQALREETGGIAKSNGKMAEEFIYNTLERDMTFAGIKFDFIEHNKKKKITALGIDGEYDIVLTNGDTLAIIETKYKVREKDVSKFIDIDLGKYKILYPEYKNYKMVLGIGGMSFEDNAIEKAKENGMGIIKIVGDKVEFYTEGMKIY